MNLKNTLLLALMAIAIISCKDDEESPSKTSLITKKWRITKYEIAGSDVTEFFSDGECADDDYLELKADKTFVEEVGTELCFTGEEDGSGTWSFKENETVLTVDYVDEDPEDFKIKQLDGSTMKLAFTDEDLNQEVTITLTKI